MKAVVVFVVTFVIALAGASGAKYFMAKPPVIRAADTTAAANDSLNSGADPSRTDTAAAVGATTVAAPADTMPVPAVAAAATKDTTPPAAAPKSPAPVPVPATAANDSASQEPEKRLAKVFTSMDAKQAAKVLEHMSDGDVQIILGYVGPRQAASILAELPPERVAAISKQSMQGAKR